MYTTKLGTKLLKIFSMFLLSLFFSQICSAETKNISPYSIIVTVNDTAIFQSDLNIRLKILHLFNSTIDMNKKLTKKAVLSQMINEALIIQDSKNYDISVTKDDVNQELYGIEKLNNWTKQQLNTKVLSSSIDKEAIKQYLYNQALIKNTLEAIKYINVSVSNTEVEKEYYNILGLNGDVQYLLSEIYIKLNLENPKESLSRINDIYNKLNNNNFSTIAKTYSDNLFDRVYNGDIGWLYENQISNDLKSKLNMLKKGQFTKPILLNDGYYIFLLRDKKPILNIDISDPNNTIQLKLMIRNKINNEKTKSVIDNYIETLNNRAFIQYYENI